MNWYKKSQINEGKAKIRNDGWYVVLGRNTKLNEGPWRISIIKPDKSPYVHADYKTYQEAEERFDMYSGEEQNVYELV